MSSISIALAVWSRMLSAALTLVAGGVAESSMIFPRVEIGFLHPPQQRFRRDVQFACRLFDGAVGQERNDSFLLLASEFCPVSGHLRTPEDIWPRFEPSPTVHQR